MLDIAVKEKVIPLPQAIRLATYNPSRAIPILGNKRGLLERGYGADVALVDETGIGKVRSVIIDGKLIF
jgi:alpha-D-ribose 1-methylphosphonate 5-triphosphate diphosphatase PhnM